jgi:hypothetical protein
MDEENLKFNTDEAALYLGCAAGTLENWRVQRRGPMYYKPAGKVFYYKQDLDQWIKKGASE